jgi:hypothetical protein
VAAGPGRFIPGRARCSCVPAVPAIQVGWLIPEGVSRLWRLGCGADAEVSSRRRGVGGGGERGGQLPQLVRVAGLAAHTPGTGRKTASPFPPPPSSPAAGYSFSDHIASSPQGGFCFCEGGIGGPSVRLAARAPTSDARLGLTVTVRCHRSTICGSALSLGLTRVAPVRLRLADPPGSGRLNRARIAPRRTPSSSATGGTRPAPACARRSTAPCPSRASIATSPGTSSSARPSGS